MPSRGSRKKKNDCKESLLRRTFKGTNTTFLSSFSSSLSIHLVQYTDLAQPEMRVLCELVGTLNVLSVNKHTDQSRWMSRIWSGCTISSPWKSSRVVSSNCRYWRCSGFRLTFCLRPRFRNRSPWFRLAVEILDLYMQTEMKRKIAENFRFILVCI